MGTLNDEADTKERPLIAQGQRSQTVFSRILVLIIVSSSSFPFGSCSPSNFHLTFPQCKKFHGLHNLMLQTAKGLSFSSRRHLQFMLFKPGQYCHMPSGVWDHFESFKTFCIRQSVKRKFCHNFSVGVNTSLSGFNFNLSFVTWFIFIFDHERKIKSTYFSKRVSENTVQTILNM